MRLPAALVLLALVLLPLRPPAALAGGDAQRIARGRQLAEQHGCAACHRMPGAAGATSPELEPPLGGFGGPSDMAGHLPNRPEMLARLLDDPPSLVPGTVVPRTGLSPDAACDVAARLTPLDL